MNLVNTVSFQSSACLLNIAQLPSYKEVIEDCRNPVPRHIAFAVLDDPSRGAHNPQGNLVLW